MSTKMKQWSEVSHLTGAKYSDLEAFWQNNNAVLGEVVSKTLWQSGTYYAVNATIDVSDGLMARAKSAGTSGSTEPTWTEGNVTDGSVTWEVTNKNFGHDYSAGYHNSIYRGKYLGSSISTKQNTAIANRTYDDMFIGDYWTIGGVNYRIAGFEYYYNCGDSGFTVGHIIVVPDTCLTYAVMNDTNTTAGGYANSKMRGNSGGLASVRSTIASAFGSHVASHRIIMTNASDSTGPTGWGWMDSDGIELMNEVQVYGCRIWGSPLQGYEVGTQKQQLPLFALSPKHINTRQDCWLQDISAAWPAGNFALVGGHGNASYGSASRSIGVRPAITLKAV